jgi:hypothetical protein
MDHLLKMKLPSEGLNETSLLSFFIIFLSCHQKILCSNLFIENETALEVALLILSYPVSSSSNFFLTFFVGLSASLNVRIVYLDIS